MQLVTSVAVPVDVYTCGADLPSGANPTPTYFAQYTAITTATTTDIAGAPTGTNTRNVKTIKIRNKHASTACDVTLLIDVSGVDTELYKITLRAGETLQYIEELGAFTIAGPNPPAPNVSLADQTANAADTYITGSSIIIPAARPLAIGTRLFWRFKITKTGAGIAAPVFSVRFGTAGTVADTARLVFTGAAQTGVIDTATVTIWAIVRGPINASGIVTGGLTLHHNLAATGFANVAHDDLAVTSSAFDVTTAGMIVGVSANPGSAGVWTFPMATGEVDNI